MGIVKKCLCDHDFRIYGGAYLIDCGDGTKTMKHVWKCRKCGKESWEKNMFKNCVFKVSVDTQKWVKCAAVRAIKTVAQTFVATVGTATVMGAVDWKVVISTSVLAGVISIATSIAGLPEVKAE